MAPPGQDSCQPGPDMTSAEGEAGRHSQWVGGVSGAVTRGRFERGAAAKAVHAQLWLTSWKVIFLGVPQYPSIATVV